MHGTLLVIGRLSESKLRKLLPKGTDGARLDGTSSLALKPGAKGTTALMVAEREGWPEIIIEHLKMQRPRVKGGVDQALKRDITNLAELADLLHPAWVIAKGKRLDANREYWFDEVDAQLAAAADDDEISVYDVHL